MRDRAQRDDALPGNAQRYNALAIAFHWLTALLVGSLYALGQLRSLPGRGSALQHLMLTTHYGLGLTLAVLIVLRLAWRATHKAPDHEKGLMGLAATAGHIALYLLMIAAVTLGILLKWHGAHPIPFFGLFQVPSLVNLAAVPYRTLFSLHALAANGIVIVVGLHAAAALLHHYVLRDETLHRMLPGSWRLPRSRRVTRLVVAVRRAIRPARPV
jgi:cytochrome b561